MLVVPARDGLTQRDILDELLARQPRVGARVRLLRPQPGRDGLPLVRLAGAGGDLEEGGAASSHSSRPIVRFWIANRYEEVGDSRDLSLE